MKISITVIPIIRIVERPWACEPDRPEHKSSLCESVSKTVSLRHLSLPIK